MAPPSYADLGKSAKDLFSKGYHYGIFKLELKSKTKNGVEFTAGGNHNFDSAKVSGNLETKYKWSDIGITFTEKWNTDNILSSEITIEDQLVAGLKLSFDTSFAPQTGKKSGKVKSQYKTDCLNAGCDVDFDFAGPQIHGSSVFGYHGYLLGYQMSFDTAKSTLTKNNFALGFATDDFTLHTNVNNGSEFSGSIYQQINPDLEAGVSLSWNSNSNATFFGIGGKYKIDEESSVSTKVNNSGQLGIGYTTNLRDGIKVSLSSLLDCKQLNTGGHKLGFCVELNA